MKTKMFMTMWLGMGVAFLGACGEEPGNGDAGASVPTAATGDAHADHDHAGDSHGLESQVEAVTGKVEQATQQVENVTQQAVEKAQETIDAVSDKADEAAGEAQAEMSQKIDAFVEQAGQLLSEQGSKISSLKTTSASTDNDMVKDLIGQLEAKFGSAGDLLGKIRGSDASSFEGLKDDFSTLMSEMGTLYTQAMEKLASLKGGEGLDDVKNAAQDLLGGGK